MELLLSPLVSQVLPFIYITCTYMTRSLGSARKFVILTSKCSLLHTLAPIFLSTNQERRKSRGGGGRGKGEDGEMGGREMEDSVRERKDYYIYQSAHLHYQRLNACSFPSIPHP